jgi:two-component system cell cycle response regulator
VVLDEFRAINDQFGHPAGDSVLLTVADRIHECLRTADMLSRYGGDEFVVLLPQTDAGGAREVGERIRRNVTDKPFAASGKPFPISISVGLATYDTTENATWEELLKHADEALYDAKAGGRNKVAAWKSFAYQDLARRDAG